MYNCVLYEYVYDWFSRLEVQNFSSFSRSLPWWAGVVAGADVGLVVPGRRVHDCREDGHHVQHGLGREDVEHVGRGDVLGLFLHALDGGSAASIPEGWLLVRVGVCLDKVPAARLVAFGSCRVQLEDAIDTFTPAGDDSTL